MGILDNIFTFLPHILQENITEQLFLMISALSKCQFQVRDVIYPFPKKLFHLFFFPLIKQTKRYYQSKLERLSNEGDIRSLPNFYVTIIAIFFSVTADIFFLLDCSEKLAEERWGMKGGKQSDINRGIPVPFLKI